jgi:hypothetical protein
MDSWFSDHTLMAEGPVLHSSEAALTLPGNFNRPLVLGFAGAALGALMLRRTLLSSLALGIVGAILGAAAWFAVITSATGEWLHYQTEVAQLPRWPAVVAFGSILWVAIGWAWLSERSERAV